MTRRYTEPVWLAHNFFEELVLIYPVYAIMMLDQGMTEMQLSTLFVIWAVAALLFEIPSGVIADRVDRRRYLFVGSLAGCCGFLVWWLWPGFWGFAAGFVLWSLGGAVRSGTQQSLLHDLLAEEGRPQAFARIYGRGKGASSVALLIAMALGGYAAQNGYGQVLVLSALAPVISGGLVLLFLREPPRTGSMESDVEEESPLREALKAIAETPRLRLIALMFVVFLGLSGVVDEYVGPLLKELETFSLGTIGVLYGLVLGCRGLGTSLAHRGGTLPLRQIGYTTVLSHGLLLLGLLLGSLAGGIWLVLLMCLYFAVMGAIEVLLEANLQANIEVSARATITSVAGAGLEVWATGLFLLIGVLATRFDWGMALAGVAALAMLIALVLARLDGGASARHDRTGARPGTV